MISFLEKESPGLVLEDPEKRIHPLIGIFGKSLLPYIRKNIKEQKRKVITLVKETELQILPYSKWKKVDPNCLSLININKREDYEKLQAIDSGLDPSFGCS